MLDSLSDAAGSFSTVAHSLNVDLDNHFYIAISRDNDNRISGCHTTLDRNRRASLTEINEFANMCFQQYHENSEAISGLRTIERGLQTIHDNVEQKDRGCCGLGHLWFKMNLGNYILEMTDAIILRISNLTKTIVLDHASSEELSEEESQESIEESSPEVCLKQAESCEKKFNGGAAASEWYSKAAKCYENQGDYVKASEYYERAAWSCRDISLNGQCLAQCLNVLRCFAADQNVPRNSVISILCLTAFKSFNLDISLYITDAEERSQFDYEADCSMPMFLNRLSELMLLAARDGKPSAMSWLGHNQQPRSDDWFLAAAIRYEQLDCPEEALEHYELSAENGSLEALKRMVDCYATGGLYLEKADPAKACYYQLLIAEIYLNNAEMFIDACKKAFALEPKRALIDMIRCWSVDITRLFTKEQIEQAGNSEEIGDAYAEKAESLLDEDSETALHLCILALKFGSSMAVKILEIKLGRNLEEIITDPQERERLYINAGYSIGNLEFTSDIS